MKTIEQMYNDAKALVEDRTYNIGEISEKTGLQKTANGWVKPKSDKGTKKDASGPKGDVDRFVKNNKSMWQKNIEKAPDARLKELAAKSEKGNAAEKEVAKMAKKELAKRTSSEKKENIEKLKTQRTELDNQINKIGKENEKIFDENNGFREGTDSAGYKKWNENKQKIRELQKQKDDITDKIVKTKSEENISKRKVNGYGEATSRENTSKNRDTSEIKYSTKNPEDVKKVINPKTEEEKKELEYLSSFMEDEHTTLRNAIVGRESYYMNHARLSKEEKDKGLEFLQKIRNKLATDSACRITADTKIRLKK